MHSALKTFLGVVAVLIVVLGANWASVGHPVSSTLEDDPRNATLRLKARHAYYASPGTLVLDLSSADDASPADVGRALFQAAERLRHRSFRRVILAHGWTPIFHMKGDDFRDLGQEFAVGQNPIYMTRNLPSKLYEPDGNAAYGSWTGGLIGVVSKQMEDYGEAMVRWATGSQGF